MALSLHNATVKAGTSSVGSAVVLHTATAGSVLLVWTHTNEASSLSAVQIGATQLTRLAAISASASRVELWGLTAPGSGTLTISAQAVGANVMRIAMIATTFVGQQQGTSPFGGTNVGTAQGVTTAALSVSATATDLVVVGFAISANTALVLNAGATTHASVSATTGGRMVVGSIVPSGTTVSASASASAAAVFGMIGIHLLAKPDPISTLADQFTSDTITSGDWTKWSGTNGGVAVITISSSAVVITPDGGPTPLGFPEPAWGVDSSKVYLFSGSTVYARIDPPSTTAADTGSLRTLFGVVNADPAGFNQPNDEGIGFEIAHLGGAHDSRKIMALVWGDVADTFESTANAGTITYVAANHAWFQLRNDGTNVFWEVAPDNGTGGPGTFSQIATMTVASISTFDDVQLWLHRSRIRFWTKVVNDSYSNTFLITPARMLAVNTADSALAVLSATFTATDTPDTFSASAKVRVTARLSATDAQDVFAATIKNRVSGRMSATDVVDTFAATIKNRVSGRLSATESVADTFASTAKVRVSAFLAATDAPDTFAAVAAVRVTAFMAATDAPDTFAATAQVIVQASMAATDAADTFAATAQVRVTSNFSATDAPDIFFASATTASASADGTITARLSATDAADTFVASSYVIVQGFMSATDAQDTFLALPPARPRLDADSAGHGKPSNDYLPAGEDFWDAREAYLRSLQPELIEEPGPEILPEEIVAAEPAPANRLNEFRLQRADAITALHAAATLLELQAAGLRLRLINRRIFAQKELLLRTARREAAALQWLADAPKRLRTRRLARLRKELALLETARELLHLQDHS